MDQNALVEEHLGLVRAIATRISGFAPGSADFDDLVAFGQQGLVQASRRYDPERGVAFATFAYYRIRGAMFDGLRTLRGGRAPRRRLVFEERAGDYLEHLAAEPAPPTAVAAAELLAGAVADLATAYVVCSDRIEEARDPSTPDPEAVAERKEQLQRVRDGLAGLAANERQLLELMYFEGMGLVEAGARLGMSRGWASRLHARAIRRLRETTTGEPEKRGPPPSAVRV